MDLKLIEKLMAAMNRNGMRRVSFKEGGFELEVEKDEPYSSKQPARFPESAFFAPASPLPDRLPEKSIEEPKSVGQFITSPMVGTFYLTPSPKDPVFVKVGDPIVEESVVCIIEAMKVMNEVKAGMKGTIAEILVKNGDPVEFGTKMFRII